MTAREYAKFVGIEVIGKLTKSTILHERYDIKKDIFVEEKIVFYVDEAGNEFHKENGVWIIITKDGGVI